VGEKLDHIHLTLLQAPGSKITLRAEASSPSGKPGQCPTPFSRRRCGNPKVRMPGISDVGAFCAETLGDQVLMWLTVVGVAALSAARPALFRGVPSLGAVHLARTRERVAGIFVVGFGIRLGTQ